MGGGGGVRGGCDELQPRRLCGTNFQTNLTGAEGVRIGTQGIVIWAAACRKLRQ